MAKEPLEKNKIWTVEDIDDLEQQVERLRALYELYFQGVEKLEPIQVRKNVFRVVVKANPSAVANTGLRFRLRNLIQRYNVYQSYWNRISIQIEMGTYKRERKRGARKPEAEDAPRHVRPGYRSRRLRHLLEQQGQLPPDEEQPGDASSLPAADAEPAAALAASGSPTLPGGAAARPLTPAAPRPAPTPPDPAARQREYEQVYAELIRTRQRCNQGVDGMSFDLIAQRLEASRSSLLSSSGCREVQFKVVVEDGKAKLKAVPRS